MGSIARLVLAVRMSFALYVLRLYTNSQKDKKTILILVSVHSALFAGPVGRL